MKNEGSLKRYLWLAAAILFTVTALLFTVLAFFAGKSGSYVLTGVYVALAVLSFWGAPVGYYLASGKSKIES